MVEILECALAQFALALVIKPLMWLTLTFCNSPIVIQTANTITLRYLILYIFLICSTACWLHNTSNDVNDFRESLMRMENNQQVWWLMSIFPHCISMAVVILFALIIFHQLEYRHSLSIEDKQISPYFALKFEKSMSHQLLQHIYFLLYLLMKIFQLIKKMILSCHNMRRSWMSLSKYQIRKMPWRSLLGLTTHILLLNNWRPFSTKTTVDKSIAIVSYT